MTNVYPDFTKPENFVKLQEIIAITGLLFSFELWSLILKPKLNKQTGVINDWNTNNNLRRSSKTP